jgi:DNA polymerase III subunit epsilon
VRLFAPRTSAAAAFASIEKPAGTSPWREARWCALDLELTGLDPRRNDIIAVGAVPIEHGCVLLGESLYTLVRSSQRSEHGAVLVHKLRVADLAAAPTLEEAIELVLEVLTGRIPVFHSSAVERSFLGPLFAKRRVRLPAAADTEVLGRLWLRERDGVAPNWLSLGKLSAILKHPEEAPHHALGDAVTTAKAFVALASHLDAVEPQTVSSLVRAEDRMRLARRLG